MHINSISDQTPFTTKDGSTITSILDESNAPVKNQSLAEATLPAKGSTQRHYHKMSEEFYYLCVYNVYSLKINFNKVFGNEGLFKLK